MAHQISREQLFKQINSLPDDIVQQIADFTFFVMARRKITPLYAEWKSSQWQDFTLEQFFREEDEVEYTLKDAQEIYRP
jgi:enoyl reductase-like protein